MIPLLRPHGPFAFTLIELLICVSIISLLAALAVVNLQGARTRAGVTRVEADMRTIAGALESYRVDFAAYPPAAVGDLILAQPLVPLTTPVAYLTSLPQDPYSPAPLNFHPGLRMSGYQYKDKATTREGMPGETYGPVWYVMIPDKHYYLHSAGPNLVWDVVPYTEYDPTNGTVSAGDITRLGPM